MNHYALLPLTLALFLVTSSVFGSTPTAHGHEAADEHANSNAPIVGIKLGEFLVRDLSPVEGTKLRVNFKLYCGVKREDASAFQKTLHEQEARFRDHVLTAVRLVPLQAFEEPDLKTMRRRILLRLRRAMPELAISELYLTDFNFLSK
ncbi:MAG: hypothetical protein WD851_24015 [Pirellulales bacterium]